MAVMDKKSFFKRLSAQVIETPSWGFANSGTRFGTFPHPSAAKTIDEKFEDAGAIQKYTGICPKVALHIPWDKADDWTKAKKMAKANGVAIGAINPNVFQDPDYQFGSICHRDAKVRKKAVAHHLECIEIAKATGSDGVSLWYADGTNYPGQDSFRERKHRMQDSLAEVYAALPKGMRLFVEYKFFEPAFYHTDLADWGCSMLLCQKLGPQAQVLVDTGHHAPGTNIEHIVANLLDEGRLGGFHFNSRKYADDDLTVGSMNPYELFLIYNELVDAEENGDKNTKACAKNVAYMFDMCPTHKPPVLSVLQGAVIVQEMFAKALLVDRDALAKARSNIDLVSAEEVLRDAYNTDVRPLLAEWRQANKIEADPIKAFLASGYLDEKAKQRPAKRAAAKA